MTSYDTHADVVAARAEGAMVMVPLGEDAPWPDAATVEASDCYPPPVQLADGRWVGTRTILSEARRELVVLHGAERSALASIAGRSRGTPRIANRLLRRVRDYAQVRAEGKVVDGVVDEALALEGVDGRGLDDLDRAYLRVIGGTYRGGPVGLEAIAATMGQDAGTLEDVVEPYLLQIGFVARTRRGRQLTADGAAFVGVTIETKPDESALFAE